MTIEDTESGRDLCDALAALISPQPAEETCKSVLQNCAQSAYNNGMNSSTLLQPGPSSTAYEYAQCDHCGRHEVEVEGVDWNRARAVNGSSDGDGRVCAACVAKINAETLAAANQDVTDRAKGAVLQLESAYEIHLGICTVKRDSEIFEACDICRMLADSLHSARFVAGITRYDLIERGAAA